MGINDVFVLKNINILIGTDQQILIIHPGLICRSPLPLNLAYGIAQNQQKEPCKTFPLQRGPFHDAMAQQQQR